jgi:hypothetical protein
VLRKHILGRAFPIRLLSLLPDDQAAAVPLSAACACSFPLAGYQLSACQPASLAEGQCCCNQSVCHRMVSPSKLALQVALAEKGQTEGGRALPTLDNTWAQALTDGVEVYADRD